MEHHKNQLIEAAANNRWDVIKPLLERGADPDGSINESTLLILAVRSGRKDMVELLTDKGAKINAKGNDESTPIHVAVQEGRRDMVEMLLAKGADVNAKGLIDMTPLHLATMVSSKDMVELLLAKGADPNARNRAGLTPLHEAAISNNPGIATLLLDKGADLHILSNSHNTAQEFAVRHGNIEVAPLLAITGHRISDKSERSPDTTTENNSPTRAFIVHSTTLKPYSWKEQRVIDEEEKTQVNAELAKPDVSAGALGKMLMDFKLKRGFDGGLESQEHAIGFANRLIADKQKYGTKHAQQRFNLIVDRTSNPLSCYLDPNRDGRVSVNEFIGAMARGEIGAILRVLDLNRDGMVTIDEVTEELQSEGLKLKGVEGGCDRSAVVLGEALALAGVQFKPLPLGGHHDQEHHQRPQYVAIVPPPPVAGEKIK